jgi:hypothetical protein
MTVAAMMDGLSALFRRISKGACAGALLVSCAALAVPAHAQNLRESLFGHAPSMGGRPSAAPPVARYVSEDGDSFVLDLTQGPPLLKFENSYEVWALRPQPGPRGDTIYKNDLGEPVLRATRLGGLTVFTDDHPSGEAAAVAGASNPLRLGPLDAAALLERLGQASIRASRAARRLIPFEAEATPTSSSLIADAAMITSEAVVRMTKKPGDHRFLDRILKVRLTAGRRASAQIDQGVLQVVVAPPQGLAGRPSSERIIQVTESAR